MCSVENICEARVTCTNHGVTQDNGGLVQFVLGDPAVQQDGLQQAGVVQVNVIVPFLQSHKHIFEAPSAALAFSLTHIRLKAFTQGET